VSLWSAGIGGAVCAADADRDAAPVSPGALGYLAHLAATDLAVVGDAVADDRTRAGSRRLLFGFTEYHLERRMRSVPMLTRTAP
jgi:hypothetical protein